MENTDPTKTHAARIVRISKIKMKDSRETVIYWRQICDSSKNPRYKFLDCEGNIIAELRNLVTGPYDVVDLKGYVEVLHCCNYDEHFKSPK